ncbi:transcriptional regulator [Paenibacillus sp. P2(2022)]|uniref:ArpU family phage packaging/lysis transcriptional regulator n=1 Tax=Paenibacillus sp. P2(2022) TaxID=2917813 RepID=UPI002405E03C|nr:ArpU family phage packaging/lysis transcriptional regulator [Paenibacillus sp. P2(2022)]MDG0056974.1 transcriptional regulator [Paenibacillus sp. P2(2022)]
METKDKAKNEVFQIAFPGMEIDEDATFLRVEGALEKAAIYKRLGFVRKEIKNTATYEYQPSQRTNVISKPAETAAIANVDGSDRLKKTHDQVMKAIDRLRNAHQRIITTRYLESDDVLDVNVWLELNLAERTYYRLKREAMSELAYALGLEVKKEV